MVAVSETSKAPEGSGFLYCYGFLQAGRWSLRPGRADPALRSWSSG